jgi:hypothetical protein
VETDGCISLELLYRIYKGTNNNGPKSQLTVWNPHGGCKCKIRKERTKPVEGNKLFE